MSKIIIQSTLLLLTGLLIVLFIDYNFNIHENISSVFQVKPLGIIILTYTISILIWMFKKLKLKQPEINLIRYTVLGTIIVFVSEAVYQLARQLTFIELDTDTRIKMYISSLSGMTLFGMIISFIISHQLKTRNSTRTVLFVLIFMFSCYIIQKYWMNS